MKKRLVVIFVFFSFLLFAGCEAEEQSVTPAHGSPVIESPAGISPSDEQLPASVSLTNGPSQSTLSPDESPSSGAASVSFISGMDCNDPNCTDPSHHHDCPADCGDYDHHHNCGLDCTDASHHHSEHHEDKSHYGSCH